MIVVTFFVGVLVGLILSVLLERREDVNPSNLGRLNRLRGLYRKYKVEERLVNELEEEIKEEK